MKTAIFFVLILSLTLIVSNKEYENNKLPVPVEEKHITNNKPMINLPDPSSMVGSDVIGGDITKATK